MTSVDARYANPYGTAVEPETEIDLGLAGEIALLVLNNENVQEEADRAERNAAREMRREAAEEEVEALKDAADALRTGAWVSGAMCLAGGALTVAGGVMSLDAECAEELRECDVYSDSGDIVSRLAQPANTLIGQSTAESFRADAKQAAFEGEQASFRVNDAGEHASKVLRNRERMLDAIETLNQAEQAATSAVIGNI
jgi:hypothetical protein